MCSNLCHSSFNVLSLTFDRQPDDDDLETLSFGQPLQQPLPSSSTSPSKPLSSPNPALSGKIGTNPNQGQSGQSRTENVYGIKTQTRFTGESTLDEPVSATIVSRGDYCWQRGWLPAEGGIVQALEDSGVQSSSPGTAPLSSIPSDSSGK